MNVHERARRRHISLTVLAMVARRRGALRCRGGREARGVRVWVGFGGRGDSSDECMRVHAYYIILF